MKIAIVHDWLTNLGGAERVVLALHELYPEAPIYTSVYEPSKLPLFKDADVRTTYLQKLPRFLRSKHQLWSPLRPRAFRKLDLSEFDVVISSSSAEAKQVHVREDAVHICYCHTPVRYFWVNPDDYIKNPGLGPLNFLAPIIVPLFLNPLKRSDYRAAQAVDRFVANSTTVQGRIKEHYGRESDIIFPPVDTERFKVKKSVKRSGFLIAGRQIPYKRFDLAVRACSELNLPLTVIGNGPEHEKLKEIAGPNVTFVSDVSDQQMPGYFAQAEAFLFPAEEDFGIVPVEAMAAGLPVIAYGRGGAKDYVVEGVSGLFFKNQTVPSLKSAIEKYQTMDFDRKKIAAHAEQFDVERFKLEIDELVLAAYGSGNRNW